MLSRLINQATHALSFFSDLDTHQWLIVFAAVVIVGFFCMRGFGSQKSY